MRKESIFLKWKRKKVTSDLKIERVKRTPDFRYKKRASSSLVSRALSACLFVSVAVLFRESAEDARRLLGLEGDSTFYRTERKKTMSIFLIS